LAILCATRFELKLESEVVVTHPRLEATIAAVKRLRQIRAKRDLRLQ
jgi:hypothetical protein